MPLTPALGAGEHIEGRGCTTHVAPVAILTFLKCTRTPCNWEGPELAGSQVQVQSDNVTTVAYINRQRGTRSSALQGLLCSDPAVGRGHSGLALRGPHTRFSECHGGLLQSLTASGGRMGAAPGGKCQWFSPCVRRGDWRPWMCCRRDGIFLWHLRSLPLPSW